LAINRVTSVGCCLNYHRRLLQAECRKIKEMDWTTVACRDQRTFHNTASCIEQTHYFVSGL